MHKKYIFSNVMGSFVFNEHFNVIDKKLFINNEQFIDKEKVEQELYEKYKNLNKPEGKELSKVLAFFKQDEFFEGFRKMNLELTKKAVRDSVKDDLLIIQTINNIDEINKSTNILIKRLREWYGLYNPEFENDAENQERFINDILKRKDKRMKNGMGGDFSKENLEPMMDLAKEINGLFELRKKHEDYLEKMMRKVCPNVLAITGATIGARLIEQAGGLKSLMLFPASTIQLLGAEKALFRHMKTGARAPKFGYLHEHPLILRNKKEKQGKIARALADKVCLAVKVDYFKGKFIGDKLLKGIEEKFK
jgi:nucleolar protein 56